jgi:hypothetical protein
MGEYNVEMKKLISISISLFHASKEERRNQKELGNIIEGIDDELLSLESLSDWTAGILLSSNSESKIKGVQIKEDMTLIERNYVRSIEEWAIEISTKFPTTSSYAHSILMQWYLIKDKYEMYAQTKI